MHHHPPSAPPPEGAASGGLRDVARRLDGMTGVLGIAVAQWAVRDETKPQPEIRRAANTAMAAIDDMLTVLHRTRSQLVSEIRAADDATAARVDAVLARSGHGAGGEAEVNRELTSGQPEVDLPADGEGDRS